MAPKPSPASPAPRSSLDDLPQLYTVQGISHRKNISDSTVRAFMERGLFRPIGVIQHHGRRQPIFTAEHIDATALPE